MIGICWPLTPAGADMNPTWNSAWFQGSPGSATDEAVAPDAVALVADPLVAVAPVVAAPDAVTPVADPLVADPPDAGAVEPQAESTPAPTSTTTLLNNVPRASRKHIDIAALQWSWWLVRPLLIY